MECAERPFHSGVSAYEAYAYGYRPRFTTGSC